MKLSVIIPCFNEQKTIKEIINKIQKQEFIEKEIIVIDDGSNDKTREALEEIKSSNIKIIFNNHNYGKGYSVRKGISESTGDILLIQDADLEYDPEDYKLLLNPLLKGYADVVFGSRFLGSQEHRVLYYWHRIGNINFSP